jgi:CrcB protein
MARQVQILGNILLVGVGGFAGSAARYAVSLWIKGAGSEFRWPVATFLVNLLGAVLIGFLWGRAAQAAEPRLWLTLGIAGFCGGFTTFSAFSFEVLELLRAGDWGLGLLYVAASVVFCVGGACCGLALAKF